MEGTVTVGLERLTYVGAVAATPQHAHSTFQFLAVPSDQVRVRNAHGPNGLEGDRWVIPPKLIHSVDEERARAVVVYVEPDSRLGVSLALAVGDPRRTALMHWRDAGRAISRDLLAPNGRGVSASPSPARLSPAVEQTVRELPILMTSKVFMVQLAGRVGLGPEQLSDLFAREVGISVRAYIRWLRLRRAVEILMQRGRIWEAARAGGFPTLRDMETEFRRAFGFVPAMTDRIEWRIESEFGLRPQ